MNIILYKTAWKNWKSKSTKIRQLKPKRLKWIEYIALKWKTLRRNNLCYLVHDTWLKKYRQKMGRWIRAKLKAIQRACFWAPRGGGVCPDTPKGGSEVPGTSGVGLRRPNNRGPRFDYWTKIKIQNIFFPKPEKAVGYPPHRGWGVGSLAGPPWLTFKRILQQKPFFSERFWPWKLTNEQDNCTHNRQR